MEGAPEFHEKLQELKKRRRTTPLLPTDFIQPEPANIFAHNS